MATIARDRRTDEMLKVALYFARFFQPTEDDRGRLPPYELETDNWTDAFRQFYPTVAGDRGERRYLASIRQDFEAFVDRLAQNRPLRPQRSELVDRCMKLTRAEFWNDIRNLRDPSRQVRVQDPDALTEIEAHASEFRDSTEREAIVKARIGQGPFRWSLIQRWTSCAVTACSEILILRASHIKPWRVCNNHERLDVNNGLLLTPNLDALFDIGRISFDDAGRILISDRLLEADRKKLGVTSGMRLAMVPPGIIAYLRYHRGLHGFRTQQ
jgi:HNH endonuclease